jgi:hypothetical protein
MFGQEGRLAARMLQLCQGNHGRNAEAFHPFPGRGAFWESRRAKSCSVSLLVTGDGDGDGDGDREGMCRKETARGGRNRRVEDESLLPRPGRGLPGSRQIDKERVLGMSWHVQRKERPTQ